MKIHLTVWAEDLPTSGLVRTILPSPHATLQVVADTTVSLGSTEVLSHTVSPDWTKVFAFDYDLGQDCKLVVSILNGDDSLGSLVFDVPTVLGQSVQAQALKTGGLVGLRLEEATDRQWQIELGLEKALHKYFFEVQRLIQSVQHKTVWDAIYRSRPLEPRDSSSWDPCFVPLWDSPHQSMRIVVYEPGRKGRHTVLGRVTVTPGQSGPTWALTKNGTETGVLQVLQSVLDEPEVVPQVKEEEEILVPDETVEEPDVVFLEDTVEEDIAVEVELDAEKIRAEPEPVESAVAPELSEPAIPPTFVNFVSGGCPLYTTLAIDATSTNGNPREETSLHAFGTTNPYEKALFTLAPLLAPFDSDQKFPVYGFGAKRDGTLNHCFLLDQAQGVDGIVQTYRQAFRAGIVMSAPRCWAPVIGQAQQEAKKALEKEGQAYSVLVMVTNGSPSDLIETQEVLKQDAPLSVVIVVVGDEKVSLDLPGPTTLVQVGGAGWTQAALATVPEQMEACFAKKGLTPRPPLGGPEELVVEPYIEPTNEPSATAEGDGPKYPRLHKFHGHAKKYGKKIDNRFKRQNINKIRRKVNTFSKQTVGIPIM